MRKQGPTDEVIVQPRSKMAILNGLTGTPVSVDARKTDSVKSAARVLDIFEFFYHFRQPARGVDVATFLELPKSSTNVLLKTLVDSGYLTFNPKAKTYFLSFRLVRFGNWLSSFYFGPQRLISMLDDLQIKCGECVALSVRNDLDMQFVTVLPAPGLPFVFAEGRKWPIVSSTIGAALLMTLEDDEVFQIAWKTHRDKPRKEREAATDEILRMTRAFRSQGYAVTRFRPNVEDTITIALPLPKASSDVPIILSVGGHKSRIAPREQELVSLMHTFVAERLKGVSSSPLHPFQHYAM